MRVLHPSRLCIVITVMLAGCSMFRPEPYPMTLVPPTAQLHYSDNRSEFVDAVEMVVTNETDWVTVWSRATGTEEGRRPVDFGERMLVVLGAGRSNPGDSIRIEQAGEREEDDDFHVTYRITKGCEDFPGDRYPLQIVLLRRSDKTPSFERRIVPADRCRQQ